jgi:hypothetical protein
VLIASWIIGDPLTPELLLAALPVATGIGLTIREPHGGTV